MKLSRAGSAAPARARAQPLRTGDSSGIVAHAGRDGAPDAVAPALARRWHHRRCGGRRCKSGANWPVTTGEFSPLRRIDDGKKGSVPKYAHCDPSVAANVRAKLEANGFRPWKDIYETFSSSIQTNRCRITMRLRGASSGRTPLPIRHRNFTGMEHRIPPRHRRNHEITRGRPKSHPRFFIRGKRRRESRKQRRKARSRPAASGPIDWLEISVELMLDGQPLSPEDVKALWQSSGRFIASQTADLSIFRRLLCCARRRVASAAPLRRAGRCVCLPRRCSRCTTTWRAPAATASYPSSCATCAKPCGDSVASRRSTRRSTSSKILRPYQRRGLDFLAYFGRYAFGGILADDMGLGKTLQVLSYLERER